MKRIEAHLLLAKILNEIEILFGKFFIEQEGSIIKEGITIAQKI